MLSNHPNVLGGSGDTSQSGAPVVGGPGSSTDTALVRWNGTTGQLVQDSNVTLATAGTALVFSGAAGLTASGSNQSITLTPSGTGMVVLPTGSQTVPALVGTGTTTAGFSFGPSGFNATDVVYIQGSAAKFAFSGTAFQAVGTSTFDTNGVLTFRTGAGSTNTHIVFPQNTNNTLFGGLTTDGTGVLQLPTATTSAGGITQGDINFYRSQAGYLILNAASGTQAALNLYVGGVEKMDYYVDSSSGIFGTIANLPLLIKTNNATAITIDTAQAAQFAKKITSYNGVSTAGWGVEVIQAQNEVTAQAAANASIATYTVGAADGSFRVSASLSCTAATVLSTTLTCSYTDKANVARTMILPVQQLTGSFIAGGLITGTGAWETPVMHIRCKAATAITIFTATGTFNTVTYSADATISQTG